MSVLQRMQEETAQLHRRFLEGQETASRTIQTLLEQQQGILQGGAPLAAPLRAAAPTAFVHAVPAPAAPVLRPAAAIAPSAIPVSAPAADRVTETLLAVVSEKTGYPVEMLELEMGMDSDLGIDSIKRVEILSALQERLPASPVIGPEHLGSLHTLGEIARHLGAGAAPCLSSSTISVPAADADRVTETLLAVVSEKTGYPVEMLELEMGMDSDLGIDSIKRVEILSALQERLPASPVIGPEHLGSLHTLGEIARHLGAGAASAAAVQPPPTPVPAVELSACPEIGLTRSTLTPCALGETGDPIALPEYGIIWVTDDGSPLSGGLCASLSVETRNVRLIRIDEEPDSLPDDNISGLVIIAPAVGTDDGFLENAFQLLKKAAPALRRSAEAGGALFCTVSRLDGAFGFGSGTGIIDPLSGGLAGLAKTAAREWPEVTCKSIDLGDFPDSAATACAIAGELFTGGPAEVGLTPSGRFGLQFSALPAPTAAPTAPLQAGDVVVVTGGGRGVTAAASIAMAAAYRPLLVLLGRSPEPLPEPAWLTPLADESTIKRAILEHATEKLHPKEIEERYRAVIAGRELTATLARIDAVGGSALYRSVDIRDNAAVSALLDSIRREHGPIRGLIHGAGVLADRLIIDKTREQFARVYGTKVAGLRTLLAATAGDDLRFIALFGSTSGRFGRSGQADYAVANEVLNKLAQNESRRRPGCRSVCFNWGPWDGGMVTPALKKVFSDEGVGLIPLQAGGELLVREIAATEAPAEVVVLAGAAPASLAVSAPQPARPLVEAFSLTLTIDEFPFIRSHVIDGKAVLPMAMIVEWLSHGALHGNPGFRFHGFNDLRVCKGVVFEQDTACTLHVMAGRAQKRDSLYVVPVELSGASSDGRTLLHARAEIVLATRLPEGIRSIVDLPTTPYAQSNSAIYDRERLFHGPDLQGIEQVGGCSAKGISALVKAAPQPATWVRQPLRNIWLTDPLVLDSAFQLMILWSFERFGSGSLPSFAGRYRQFQDSFPREGAQVVIRVTAEREHGASADMEFLDRSSGKLIARLEDYECVIDPSLQQAFRRNQLSQPGCVQLEAA
jgi:NAD(P)-dependent dehydrogenase (short-subunit alcohol dehydrogenase family)/acyl carrier protein